MECSQSLCFTTQRRQLSTVPDHVTRMNSVPIALVLLHVSVMWAIIASDPVVQVIYIRFIMGERFVHSVVEWSGTEEVFAIVGPVGFWGTPRLGFNLYLIWRGGGWCYKSTFRVFPRVYFAF